MKIRPFSFGKLGWTPVDNGLFDYVMPRLSLAAWQIVCVAIRATLGWQAPGQANPRLRREKARLTYDDFLARSGIQNRNTGSRAIRECLTRGILLRIPESEGSGFYYKLNPDFEIEVSDKEEVTEVTWESLESAAGPEETPTGDLVTEEPVFKTLALSGLTPDLMARLQALFAASEKATRRTEEVAAGWYGCQTPDEQVATLITALESLLNTKAPRRGKHRKGWETCLRGYLSECEDDFLGMMGAIALMEEQKQNDPKYREWLEQKVSGPWPLRDDLVKKCLLVRGIGAEAPLYHQPAVDPLAK